jgi:hypothetical protein
LLNLNLEAIEDTIRGAQPFRDSHACRHACETIAPALLARVKHLTAEVECLREGLEEIVGEPWLMGGQDACTIASTTLYPATPPARRLPSKQSSGS